MLELVQASVGRDAVQPTPHRTAPCVPIEVAPRPQHCLLGQILRVDPHATSNSAVSVRGRNGQRQDSTGPARTADEQLIGYYVLNCNSPTEAADLAATIPAAKVGTVEVRPVFEM